MFTFPKESFWFVHEKMVAIKGIPNIETELSYNE